MTNLVHDPICHMDIDPIRAAGTSEYEGQVYYFCSTGCKRDFDADPAAALSAEAAYDHAMSAMEPSSVAMMEEPASASRPWWQFWRK
jgi:Cu+-exporting ATPase